MFDENRRLVLNKCKMSKEQITKMRTERRAKFTFLQDKPEDKNEIY